MSIIVSKTKGTDPERYVYSLSGSKQVSEKKATYSPPTLIKQFKFIYMYGFNHWTWSHCVNTTMFFFLTDLKGIITNKQMELKFIVWTVN